MTSQPFTPEEWTAVLDHLRRPRDRCMFILATCTGLRISELLALPVRAVWIHHRPAQRIFVRRGKGSAPSAIPLSPQAIAAVQDWIPSHPEALPDRPLLPLHRSTAWRVIQRAAAAAGVDNVPRGTHSLRKSFAANIYAATGNDLRATQLALGHRSIASTAAYLAADQDQVAAQIARLHFGEAPPPAHVPDQPDLPNIIAFRI